jgi:glutathione synthase/RimK-type ligase-like ATP-grasp enzyme
VDGTAGDAGAFVSREAGAMLRGLQADMSCHWVSEPAAIERAEDKMLQLRVAERLGLRTPKTLVTNEPELARAFVESVSRAIVKPLSSGHLSDEPAKIAYTASITSNDDFELISLAPHLIQERIEKTADIRVTVVREAVFACRIDSQSHSTTSLDWRVAVNSDIRLEHVMIKLPHDIEAACVALVRELNLEFGAIDLVESSDGYIFLEINPNGQWAWIQQRTGAPISDALVDALLSRTGNT